MSGPECEQALRAIPGFRAGSITDDTREAIRNHLDDCPPCGDVYGFEEDLRRIVAAKAVDPCPGELRARIARTLGIEEQADS